MWVGRGAIGNVTSVLKCRIVPSRPARRRPDEVRSRIRILRMTQRLDQRDAMMANAELRALFDAAVDAMVAIDEVGTILAFNRAAERMFGHPAEEIGRASCRERV